MELQWRHTCRCGVLRSRSGEQAMAPLRIYKTCGGVPTHLLRVVSCENQLSKNCSLVFLAKTQTCASRTEEKKWGSIRELNVIEIGAGELEFEAPSTCCKKTLSLFFLGCYLFMHEFHAHMFPALSCFFKSFLQTFAWNSFVQSRVVFPDMEHTARTLC